MARRIGPLQYQLVAAPVSGGSATATLPGLPNDQRWEITQLGVFATSTTPTAAEVLLNVVPTGLNTQAGNLDTADGPPPLSVSFGDLLQIVWSGCSATDANGLPTVCIAILTYYINVR